MRDQINDISSLDKAVAYRIQHTARLLRFHLNKFFQAQGLDFSVEQWFILCRLAEQEGRAQSKLADKNLQDHPNITRLLDNLQRQGWVNRRPDPDDRRRHLIYLTEAGRTLMERLLPLVVKEWQRVFAGISPEEIDTLLRLLAKIEQNLVEH